MAYPRSQLASDEEPGFYHALRRSALASCAFRANREHFPAYAAPPLCPARFSMRGRFVQRPELRSPAAVDRGNSQMRRL